MFIFVLISYFEVKIEISLILISFVSKVDPLVIQTQSQRKYPCLLIQFGQFELEITKSDRKAFYNPITESKQVNFLRYACKIWLRSRLDMI